MNVAIVRPLVDTFYGLKDISISLYTLLFYVICHIIQDKIPIINPSQVVEGHRSFKFSHTI